MCCGAPTPQVRKAIGPIATPDVIHWAPGLPKTRSGGMPASLRPCCATLHFAALCCAACDCSTNQNRAVACRWFAGKIMRRVLRKIASNKLDELGDTSTLVRRGQVPAARPAQTTAALWRSSVWMHP